MALIDVTLEDTDGSREFKDPITMEPTTTTVLQVEADTLDAAKEFAETQNPGLTAIDAKKVK